MAQDTLLVPLQAERRRRDIMASYEVNTAGEDGLPGPVFVVAELRGHAGDGNEYALVCGCGRVALKPAWACEHIREAVDATAHFDAVERQSYRERNTVRAARLGLTTAQASAAALADLA